MSNNPQTDDPTPESARALLYRHGLPEDVIDGALCLHAQELAAAIRNHPGAIPYRPQLDEDGGFWWDLRDRDAAADLIDPTRADNPAVLPAVPVPPAPDPDLRALVDAYLTATHKARHDVLGVGGTCYGCALRDWMRRMADGQDPDGGGLPAMPVPSTPASSVTVDELAHAIDNSTPYPIEIHSEVCQFMAERLLEMLAIGKRDEHPVWQPEEELTPGPQSEPMDPEELRVEPAVPAVPVPPTTHATDRAAVLREAADAAEAENSSCNAIGPCQQCSARTSVAIKLRRMAAEEQQPATRDALMRAHTALAAQAGRDQAALQRVRTVLETEAVVGRSALEYRGLIASALMAAEAQQSTPRCTCGETVCESELCDCDSAPCPVDHADEVQQPAECSPACSEQHTYSPGCALAADEAAAIASCPGYEMSPSPCRCPCYGCKHHCGAHNPDEAQQQQATAPETCPRCMGSGIDPEDDLIPGSSWELPAAPPCRACATEPDTETPTEEQIVRDHVTSLHLIGEQLADIENWMWRHLADVRDASGPGRVADEEPAETRRCDGFPATCPNLRVALPTPGGYAVAVRCGCADEPAAVSQPGKET